MSNQTIDGVPREHLSAWAERLERADDGFPGSVPFLQELRALLDAKPETVAGHHSACRAVDDYKPGECSHSCKPAAKLQGELAARHPDAIIEGVMTSVGISHAIYASTVSLKHGEQVKLYAEQPVPFQSRVQPWMMACFGEAIAADRQERNHRFLEEALELVQANQCTASEAHQLVDYVYGRPVGEPSQEVGGVMVTLAALCLALGLDMHVAAETELARIWNKVEQIRAKQATKPAMSPLPGAYPDREQTAPVAVVLDERSPQDYSIEHAEYMAKSADDVLAKFQAYGLALLAVDEGGDDGEGELLENIDSTRGDLQEALVDLRGMVYEFRKRAAKSR